MCKTIDKKNSNKILLRPSFHRTTIGRLVKSNLNNLNKGEHYFSKNVKKISINKNKNKKNNIIKINNNIIIEDDIDKCDNNKNIQQIKMFLTLKIMNHNKIANSTYYKIKVFICNNKQLNKYKYLGETEYL